MKEEKLLKKLELKNVEISELQQRLKLFGAYIAAKNEGMKARQEGSLTNPYEDGSPLFIGWKEGFDIMNTLMVSMYQRTFVEKVLQYFAARYDLASNDVDLVYNITKGNFSEASELCKNRMVVNDFDLSSEIQKLQGS